MIELILWNKKVFSLANPIAAKILTEGGQSRISAKKSLDVESSLQTERNSLRGVVLSSTND